MNQPRALSLWTIYKHPRDYPQHYVARRSEIGGQPGSGIKITDDMFTADTLNELRALLPLGLVCIPRLEHDDPVIVEVWM